MQIFDEKSVVNKIEQLRVLRGWSYYKLSQRSGIPLSTIRNITKHFRIPSIPTLYKICQAFDITLSEFFLYASPSNELYELFTSLNYESKEFILACMKGLKELSIKNENI